MCCHLLLGLDHSRLSHSLSTKDWHFPAMPLTLTMSDFDTYPHVSKGLGSPLLSGHQKLQEKGKVKIKVIPKHKNLLTVFVFLLRQRWWLLWVTVRKVSH